MKAFNPFSRLNVQVKPLKTRVKVCGEPHEICFAEPFTETVLFDLDLIEGQLVCATAAFKWPFGWSG